MSRLFFAISIPEEATRPLHLVQEHLPLEGIRLTKVRDFHLTLKFLGEVEFLEQTQTQVAVRGLLKKIKFKPEDLELSFTRVGVFFYRHVPTVVWAGVKMSEALYEFQYELETALEPFGFMPEKVRFKPHVTLARVRDVNRSTSVKTVEKLKSLGVQRRSFKVDHFNLMYSDLDLDEATHYDVVESFDFSLL